MCDDHCITDTTKVIREDGFLICLECGMALGQYFVPRYGASTTPLYIYSRPERFARHIERFALKIEDGVNRRFCQLEAQWKHVKQHFSRKYFLNLNFMAYRICSEQGVDLNIYGPCIKDKARVCKQNEIYDRLCQEAYASSSELCS